MKKKLLSRTMDFGAILLGLLAVEVFTQLTVFPQHLFSCHWFTSGVHTPDERFGFVSTPNFRGYMRHPDGVWNTKFSLDEYGYRTARNERKEGETKRVLILGGASMTMSFGLHDDETVGARLASRIPEPLEVQTVAFPGFDLYRTWRLYLERVASSKETPDVAVIVAFTFDKPRDLYRTIAPDLESYPRPPSREELFRFDEGLVSSLRGPFTDRVNPTIFYHSILVHKLVGAGDKWWKRLEKKHPSWLPKLPPVVHAPNPTDPAVAGPICVPGATSSPPVNVPEGPERFTALIERMRTYFEERGTKVIVTSIPGPMMSTAECAELMSHVPAGIATMDLHGRVRLEPKDYLAIGHYGGYAADAIAHEMAPTVRQLLDEAAPLVAIRKRFDDEKKRPVAIAERSDGALQR